MTVFSMAVLASLLATLLLIMPLFAQDGNSDMGDNSGNATATAQDSDATHAENEMTAQEETDSTGGEGQAGFTPATDWRNAGAPTGGWVTVTPGVRHWYKFKYTWDRDDDDPDEAIVEMRMNPAGCAGFDVQTQGRLDFPFDDDGEFVGPIGRGTPFTKHLGGEEGVFRDEARLIWVGSAAASETYYVIVIPRTQGECQYQLSITGPTVSF
jgi:hypothetical protein